MASLRRRKGSQYWWACFIGADGKRYQRSTRETTRKQAQRLADDFEAAARAKLTVQQAQRVISDIYRRKTGQALPGATVRAYFDSWLKRKEPETARSTAHFYRNAAARFLTFMGARAGNPLFEVSASDVLAFRAAEEERVARATVNHFIKFLRMVFAQARRDGILHDNPAEGVKTLKVQREGGRRAFTLNELRALLKACSPEWRSLVLFGLYTGQRLKDLALMTWRAVDLGSDEIRLVTGKTGRQQIIPIAPPLRRHIESLPAGENPNQPLHPKAHETVTREGKASSLSRQFYEIMADAGLVSGRNHERRAEGTGDRRRVSEVSFHALRHTATSLMKNAGISPAIVQDIIGHESAAISAAYTHIEDAAKRKALGSIPDVIAGVVFGEPEIAENKRQQVEAQRVP